MILQVGLVWPSCFFWWLSSVNCGHQSHTIARWNLMASFQFEYFLIVPCFSVKFCWCVYHVSNIICFHVVPRCVVYYCVDWSFMAYFSLDLFICFVALCWALVFVVYYVSVLHCSAYHCIWVWWLASPLEIVYSYKPLLPLATKCNKPIHMAL